MAHTPERTAFSHVDAAWLRMDSRTNPMVITACLRFDGVVPFAMIEALIRERLIPQRRFRERVVDSRLPLSTPQWELDEAFEPSAHIHHVRVPAPADRAAFAALLSDLTSAPLDRARPLWQVHVVDDALGGTALVARLHHCIGDGVSLVELLLSMCDDGRVAAPARVGLARPKRPDSAGELARRAASQATTLGRLLLLPPDSASPLKGPLGTRKRVAWSEALPLADVKRIARGLGATVNDVLCAAVAGALRRYLAARGALADAERLRALLPVFFRDDERSGLGNHFGLVFLDYPIHLAEPHARVRAVKQAMDVLKAADDATVAFAVLDAVGTASPELEHIALEIFTKKATLLTTNVPGPSEPVTLGGQPLRELIVFAPVSGYIGLGVTLISYARNVYMSVYADAQLIEHPDEIAEAFADELRALCEGAGAEAL